MVKITELRLNTVGIYYVKIRFIKIYYYDPPGKITLGQRVLKEDYSKVECKVQKYEMK